MTELSKAYALVATHDAAIKLREEVAFFQCLRAQFAKLGADGAGGGPSREDLDAAVRQIISRSVASGGVIDIFAAAGMESPDISILSDEFLAEVRDMPQRNLAMEVLRKLLSDEIKSRSRKNLVQSRSRGVSVILCVRRVHPSLRPPKPTAREGDDIETGGRWGDGVGGVPIAAPRSGSGKAQGFDWLVATVIENAGGEAVVPGPDWR